MINYNIDITENDYHTLTGKLESAKLNLPL